MAHKYKVPRSSGRNRTNIFLLAPDVAAPAVEAYRLERERTIKERARLRRDTEHDPSALEHKIYGIMTAIENGGDPKMLAARRNALGAYQQALVALLPREHAGDGIALHPQAAERYRQKLTDVHSALKKGDTDRAGRTCKTGTIGQSGRVVGRTEARTLIW